MENAELKHKTFQAVIWALVRIGSTNVLGFVVFAVMARVLSPRDLRLFALSMLVVDIARIVSSAGLSDAITRDADQDEVLADTAFWANLALGCIVGAVAWFLAPVYAAAIEEPAITPVLQWLAALVPLSSLSGIHTARKLREFGHKAVAARTIVCGSGGWHRRDRRGPGRFRHLEPGDPDPGRRCGRHRLRLADLSLATATAVRHGAVEAGLGVSAGP